MVLIDLVAEGFSDAHKKRVWRYDSCQTLDFAGTGGRNRTDTGLPPRDFEFLGLAGVKSLLLFGLVRCLG